MKQPDQKSHLLTNRKATGMLGESVVERHRVVNEMRWGRMFEGCTRDVYEKAH